MKIKFNRDVVLINNTRVVAIGTDTALTPVYCLPKDADGNIRDFDGVVQVGIAKALQYPVKAGTVISIYSDYNYNKETNELYFRCRQEIGPDYQICLPDLMDETCYFVEKLTSNNFEILE